MVALCGEKTVGDTTVGAVANQTKQSVGYNLQHSIMRNYSTTIAILFSGSLLCGVALSAATAAGEDPRTIVDRVYSVAQAERGEGRFKTSCSSCHTVGSFAGGSFAERWSGQTMAEVFD